MTKYVPCLVDLIHSVHPLNLICASVPHLIWYGAGRENTSQIQKIENIALQCLWKAHWTAFRAWNNLLICHQAADGGPRGRRKQMAAMSSFYLPWRVSRGCFKSRWVDGRGGVSGSPVNLQHKRDLMQQSGLFITSFKSFCTLLKSGFRNSNINK